MKWKIGEEPFCNRRPETAPMIFGKRFVLCWRCTSIGIGLFATYLPLDILNRINLYIAFLLIVPCTIDGMLVYFCNKYESNNKKRIIFGLLCGVGLRFLIHACLRL